MIKQTSFTLIELLVVIVIIGILAGVIMISTSSSIDKANITKLKVFEESVSNNLAASMVSAWDADHVTKGATWILNDKWESNNGTFYDTTSTCSSVAPIACPQVTSDNLLGNVLSFDGTNDYIDCGSDSSLDILHEITISVWVKPQLDNNYRTILSRGYSANNNKGYSLFIDTNNKFSTYFFNSSGVIIDKRFSYLQDDVWQHIIISFNGSVGKGYLNSIYQDSFNCDGLKGSDYKFIIGRLSQSNLWFFKGSIDDVRIYDAALSSSQIKRNYVAGLDSLLSKNLIFEGEYNERINALAYGN